MTDSKEPTIAMQTYRHTLDSVKFLSRLPVHLIDTRNTKIDFAKSAYAFPLAGIVIALPAAILLVGLSQTSLPALATATLVVFTLVMVTGALHEDGLADVADGFWGGHDRIRKLAIMRDSAIGTYGVLALIFSISLRIILWSAIISAVPTGVAAILILATASLSRAAIFVPWQSLLPARPASAESIDEGKDPSGLSARYGHPADETRIPLLLCSLPAIVMLVLLTGPVSAILSLLLCFLAAWYVTALARHHIGGHTGDVLGATQQMSELGLLVGLVATM